MKNQRVALLHWLVFAVVLLLGACKKNAPPVYEEKKLRAEALLDSISNLLIQDPESVIALSDSILKIAIELDDDSLKSAALIEKGGVYIELGNTFAFDSCLHAALAIQFEGVSYFMLRHTPFLPIIITFKEITRLHCNLLKKPIV